MNRKWNQAKYSLKTLPQRPTSSKTPPPKAYRTLTPSARDQVFKHRNLNADVSHLNRNRAVIYAI